MARPTGMVPCLITDSHRDVFFGTVDFDTYDPRDGWVALDDARHCYSFPTTEGVYQLAQTGPPLAGSRIGPTVPFIILRDVVSVTPCSPAAVRAFRAVKWTR